jgi:hypothetical protein
MKKILLTMLLIMVVVISSGCSDTPADKIADDGVNKEAVVDTFDILDYETKAPMAMYHIDHWHGQISEIPEGENLVLTVFAQYEGNKDINIDGEEYKLSVKVSDGAEQNVVRIDEESGKRVVITGLEKGKATKLTFSLLYKEEIILKTADILVFVGNEDGTAMKYANASECRIIFVKNGKEVAVLKNDTWEGCIPDLTVEGKFALSAYIIDNEGNIVRLVKGSYEIEAENAEGFKEELIGFKNSGDRVSISGIKAGEAEVVFVIKNQESVYFKTPKIKINVVPAK